MVKLLVLIIYSASADYKTMLDINQKYMQTIAVTYPQITYYFIKCDGDMAPGTFKIQDNMLIIGGVYESIIPGILYKTIQSFIACQILNIEYDYVLRTNISTITNFDCLINNILDICEPFNYGAVYYEKLAWLDEKGGIVDDQYFGVEFAQGTNIILSYYAVQYLIGHYNEINYSIVDDVSIAVFATKHFGKITQLNGIFAFIVNDLSSGIYLNSDIDKKLKQITFFRHKTNDRLLDCKYLKSTANILLKNIYGLNYLI